MLSLNSFTALVDKVKRNMSRGLDESNTKAFLIYPLLRLLGYDLEDDMHVRYEYSCDYDGKNGKKVDIAILDEGKPAFLIEAKAVGISNWDIDVNNMKQIRDYFSYAYENDGVRLLVHTNGVEYRFYSDLGKNGFMDKAPFKIINMLHLTDADISFLSRLSRDGLDIESLRVEARSVGFLEDLKEWLERQMLSISPSFLSFMQGEIDSCPDSGTEVSDCLRKAITTWGVTEGAKSVSSEGQDEGVDWSGIYDLAVINTAILKLVRCRLIGLNTNDSGFMPCKAWSDLPIVLGECLMIAGVSREELVRTGYYGIQKNDIKGYSVKYSDTLKLYCNTHGSAEDLVKVAKSVVIACNRHVDIGILTRALAGSSREDVYKNLTKR